MQEALVPLTVLDTQLHPQKNGEVCIIMPIHSVSGKQRYAIDENGGGTGKELQSLLKQQSHLCV